MYSVVVCAQAIGSKDWIRVRIEVLLCSSSPSWSGWVKCVDDGDESEVTEVDLVRHQHFQLMIRISQRRSAGQPMNEIFSARRRESWTVGVGGRGLLIL